MGGLKHECGIAPLYHLVETLPSRVHDGDPDQIHTRLPIGLRSGS